MTDRDRRRVDVVIVGAGPGGLCAASLLPRAGRDVVVMEAARVGGRLLSVAAAGGHLDLGASWYWPGEQRVDAVVHTLGLSA